MELAHVTTARHNAAVRTLLVRFFRAVVQIFYRRVEVAGLENVPPAAPVIFAVNHPNGLIDPLFILGFAARPVSFLAKAPLFRYPFIGWIVRALDCIPVYRRQDDVAGSNEQTFARARAILASGGGIAIFPEGTSHSDAQLRELKTGAARIALGSAAGSVNVVPTGIYYSAKGAFRSDALVVFGSPILTGTMTVGDDGEPPAAEVERLTDAIDEALDSVTLQADSRAALALIEQAEEIFRGRTDVAGEFETRRRFVDGYHYLMAHDPERLARLASAVTRLSEELGRARLAPNELVPRFRVWTIVRIVVQLPLAAAGAVLHYPAYWLVGVLARRFAHGEDELIATIKFIAALLFFPLTWILCAGVAWHFLGGLAALAILIAAPLLGYAAMRVFETADVLIGRLRAVTIRRRSGPLGAAREDIRREVMAVAAEMDDAATAPLLHSRE